MGASGKLAALLQWAALKRDRCFVDHAVVEDTLLDKIIVPKHRLVGQNNCPLDKINCP